MINESLVDNYSLQGAYIELTSECNETVRKSL